MLTLLLITWRSRILASDWSEEHVTQMRSGLTVYMVLAFNKRETQRSEMENNSRSDAF